jgi:hypothetical protein
MSSSYYSREGADLLAPLITPASTDVSETTSRQVVYQVRVTQGREGGKHSTAIAHARGRRDRT